MEYRTSCKELSYLALIGTPVDGVRGFSRGTNCGHGPDASY